MLDIDIAFFVIYGFEVCVMLGFLPVLVAGVWHILKML